MRAASLKQIAAEYDSLPRDPDELMELPGVGPYVANATVCFACGEALPVLDRNVKRIYGRVFGARWPDTPSDQEAFAHDLLPEDEARTYNLALLDFGAAVCTGDPRCEICFAPEYCTYYAAARR
ncbi:A/G-specific adenine glycosylase [Halarchaeum acidiphilum MH1-52-1]|uniref:Adenine DNA glycosylase n=1 Tax=Halarchaeum acidiphilum MH1-52-1 TaxID=1261545 RepID=U3ABB0_9EURY|nr:A/G-specific adenine glycosylase [Halarchaeum acidiphilum MH1-52-1]